jgi:hypothetical protein
MPLDPDTWTVTHAVIERARVQGLDLAEALDQAHLLLSPKRRREAKVEILETVIAHLDNWRPAELLRRKFRSDTSCSPADMQSVIIDFLQEFTESVRASQLF